MITFIKTNSTICNRQTKLSLNNFWKNIFFFLISLVFMRYFTIFNKNQTSETFVLYIIS